MQKIGLLELANHNEVLRAYLLILLESDQAESVDVYTNQWNFDQLYDFQSHDRVNWKIIKDASELENHRDGLEKLSILIQTTIEDAHAKVLDFEPYCKLAVVIHKANCQFSPYHNLHFSSQAVEFVKDVGRLLKFAFLKKPALDKAEKKADILLFPSENAIKRANNVSKRMVYFPFTVNDECSKVFTRDQVHITIPGIITDKSRDYKVVIEALEKAKSKNLKLTLLGKPKGKYGKQILEGFAKVENLELAYFNEFIPQEKFDQVMQSTDFLILPMQEKMSFGVITEDNGYSCVSGNINDMIRYGIPALLPAFYPLNNSLKSVVGQYQNAKDLTNLIDHWAEEKVYDKIKIVNMKEAMMPFDKKELSKIVNELI